MYNNNQTRTWFSVNLLIQIHIYTPYTLAICSQLHVCSLLAVGCLLFLYLFFQMHISTSRLGYFVGISKEKHETCALLMDKRRNEHKMRETKMMKTKREKIQANSLHFHFELIVCVYLYFFVVCVNKSMFYFQLPYVALLSIYAMPCHALLHYWLVNINKLYLVLLSSLFSICMALIVSRFIHPFLGSALVPSIKMKWGRETKTRIIFIFILSPTSAQLCTRS